MSQEEAVRFEVGRCLAILGASERGRDVLQDLHRFLSGRISHLDNSGWSAVQVLLSDYRDGFPGTVLESLEPYKGVQT